MSGRVGGCLHRNPFGLFPHRLVACACGMGDEGYEISNFFFTRNRVELASVSHGMPEHSAEPAMGAPRPRRLRQHISPGDNALGRDPIGPSPATSPEHRP